MPTTSNFGWTTPADTDLVKDGAAAIRTLGNGIDTSLVDLKGGTTGQVLSKNSNTDLDYTWVTPNVGDITEVQAGVGISVSSGTGPIPVITNSSTDLITTAGDILYGTAADTVARLGIGTAGQVLKVNSGATAPEWGSAAASFVGCGMRDTATQSTSAGVDTAVTFNTEYFDSDGFHSTSSNTSRITIPSSLGGKYLFMYSLVNLGAGTANYSASSIRLNGTKVTGIETLFSDLTYTTLTQTVILDVVATDYVEVYFKSDAAGSIPNYRTFFCVKVG